MSSVGPVTDLERNISQGLSEAAAGCQIPSVAGLSLVNGWNQFVKPTITMNLDNNLLITEFLPSQTL